MSEKTPPQVIVIGSGFAGSVAARELAEAGIDVTLVERGPWRDTVPVRSMKIPKRSPLPRGWAGFLNLLRTVNNNKLFRGRLTTNKRGLFEVFIAKGLNVVCSSGVGGGSHVYAGFNVPPPDENYWEGVGGTLTAAKMQRSYQRVMEGMGSRVPMADDRLPNTLSERFRDNPEMDVANADFEIPVGYLFAENPGEPKKVVDTDGIERYEAMPGEDGNLGSEKGGKTTLDFAFLAKGLKHGLRVKDLHEVRTIRKSSTSDLFEVHTINHHTGEETVFRATHVFLGAGTMNTLRILLQSVAEGGLNACALLGKYFGGNGDYFGYWDLKDDQRDLSVGMPGRGLLKVRDKNPLGPDKDWPLLGEGAFPSPTMLPMGGWVRKKLQQGSYVAGMGADAQNGEVSLKRGKLIIKYNPADSELFSRIKEAFRVVGEKTKSKIYHFERPITVHPTGGAIIGESDAHGVIDANGEMYNNAGLFVVDAAAFPKPIAGPPAMSIAAWSDHVVSNFIEKYKHNFSD